jgi:hypothetical protein
MSEFFILAKHIDMSNFEKVTNGKIKIKNKTRNYKLSLAASSNKQ